MGIWGLHFVAATTNEKQEPVRQWLSGKVADAQIYAMPEHGFGWLHERQDFGDSVAAWQ